MDAFVGCVGRRGGIPIDDQYLSFLGGEQLKPVQYLVMGSGHAFKKSPEMPHHSRNGAFIKIGATITELQTELIFAIGL